MAMRKVGANAYLREFIPIVYFSIVFTGWKLFSAGSSESLVWSGLCFVLSFLGWKLFSASSPGMKFGSCTNGWLSTLVFCSFVIGTPYVAWKLFSAGFIASFYGSVYFISGVCFGWQLFSAGSPATQNGYFAMATLIILFGDRYSFGSSDFSSLSRRDGFLSSFFAYAQAVCNLCGVGVSLSLLFYFLRHSRIRQLFFFYCLMQTFSFPCATATKRPTCKSNCSIYVYIYA